MIDPNNSKLTSEKLKKDMQKYRTEIITATTNLRRALIDQYINKPYPNLYEVIAPIKLKVCNFFKKSAQ